MGSKVVPQGIQNGIKSAIGKMVDNSTYFDEDFKWDENTGTLTAFGQYEVLMVVIPKQSAQHSEVRNG